jgi:predicted double-glycine peptidase
VYEYIPSGEVWIDIRQDPREMPFTLAHELHERALMAKGVTYDDAHRQSTDLEHALRLKALARAARPLRMKPFRQTTDGTCGPASLVIAASHFGYAYKEADAEALCRKESGRRTPTRTYGTDHAEMIGAAKALGAEVHAEQQASITDLSYWILKKRVPVIVGWFVDDPKDSGDHFSVVYHLTKTHAYLMDPDRPNGRRKMTLSKFLRVWHDTDTPKDVRVDRWFMAVSFKHKVAA